jgi:membrane protease YdiL (CAAX protease family)
VTREHDHGVHEALESLRAHKVTPVEVTALVLAIGLTDWIVERLAPAGWSGLIKAAILALFVLGARWRARLTWAELGLARKDAREGLRVGFGAMLLIGFVIAALVAIPATRGYFTSSRVAHDSTTERILEPLVIIPLGTAVFEETIFRGVLLGVLLRDWTTRRAVIFSSVLFGLWHIPPALDQASHKGALGTLGVVAGTVAVTAAAGVLFAYVRIRSRSLIAPVLAHTATNSLAYVGAIVALQL